MAYPLTRPSADGGLVMEVLVTDAAAEERKFEASVPVSRREDAATQVEQQLGDYLRLPGLPLLPAY